MGKPSKCASYLALCGELEQARASAAARLTLKSICELPKSELLVLQDHLGFGSNWGVVEFPKKWLPKGPAQASKRVQIRTLGGSTEDMELAAVTFARIAILLWLTKCGFEGRPRFLKPYSIIQKLSHVRVMLSMAMTKQSRGDGQLLARLSVSDILTGTAERSKRSLLNWLGRLASRGQWKDVPQERAVHYETDEGRLDLASTQVKVDFAETLPEPKHGWKPLPDRFVADAGWRMIWLVERLGPALIQCATGLIAARREAQDVPGKGRMRDRVRHATDAYLSSFLWRTPEGDVIDRLPFELALTFCGGAAKGNKKGGGVVRPPRTFTWPPKFLPDINALLLILQDSHLFLFLLPTGGRISECASLTTSCVVDACQGSEKVEGRTYKIVEISGGELREWPVPTLTLNAIRQQLQVKPLAEALAEGNKRRLKRGESVETVDLWTTATAKSIEQSVNQRLNTTIRHLGIINLLEGDRLHTHRCRKTIARLAALAIVGAPKLLMDLFGHGSIVMTLHYILRDPLIQAEMKSVAKAQTIMMAEQAIKTAEDCGGAAAKRIAAARKNERTRIGSDYGATNDRELAEVMTNNGQAWFLVRENIVCTKQPDQSGACTKARGIAQPGSCKTDCWHRLELAAAIEDADRALRAQVNNLQVAMAEGSHLQVELWRGQVLATLPRFPKLREKWSTHPIVAELLWQAKSNQMELPQDPISVGTQSNQGREA